MARSLLSLLAVLALTMIAAALATKSTQTSSEEGGKRKQWALLVAGSQGYDNYRHQADVCHAFQLLNRRGIPEENIVVMMYDDIAQHDLNPEKGTIVNSPNGSDVYEGVPKDYTGPNVTPENFLRVLQGKSLSEGSKKTIASGPKDHIFVFFSGHGGSGVLAFPGYDENRENNDDALLFAPQLIQVISKMHEENRYAKMVIYLESCYSGSMFEGLLPQSLNVYATTAANAHESSWGLCVDENRNTSLGDVYSVNWMEHSENNNLMATTLGAQYSVVRRKTNESHVMEYGDTAMRNIYLSEFQGRKNPRDDFGMNVLCEPVSNRDLPIVMLNNTAQNAEDPAIKKYSEQRLKRTLDNRAFLERKLAEIATLIAREKKGVVESLLTSKSSLKNFDCYTAAVRHFDVKCFRLSANPYALHNLGVFVNACESGYPLRDILSAMNSACTHKAIRGII